MLNCPYTSSCKRLICDFSCKVFAEYSHWTNRCKISLNNPAIKASLDQISLADTLIKKAAEDNLPESSFTTMSVYSGNKPLLIADLVTYLAITRYCKDAGFYNGTYKLDFADYLDETKKSWNNRYNATDLEDMKIWIRSSKYLIITNLGLVKFGDFESQLLLSILQERYEPERYTIIVLDKGRFALPGKQESMFYSKLRNELKLRGVKL